MEKILVVDDEQVVRDLLRDFLTQKGYGVVTADDGDDALSKFKQEKPILVLLDIKMPGMDGVKVLKRIREIDSSVCVIMISVLWDKQVAEEALKVGATDYILKPFDLDYLETCVFANMGMLTW